VPLKWYVYIPAVHTHTHTQHCNRKKLLCPFLEWTSAKREFWNGMLNLTEFQFLVTSEELKMSQDYTY